MHRRTMIKTLVDLAPVFPRSLAAHLCSLPVFMLDREPAVLERLFRTC